jgi:FkbM family methyltransferase
MPNQDQTHPSPITGEHSFMNSIKLGTKQAIAFPLRLLHLAAVLYIWVLSKMRPHFGYLWIDFQSQKISQLIREVIHASGGKNYPFKFHTPNYLCEIRATTFSTKEPETLAWIDEYGGEGAFFDIGANVGLYSAYFGSTKPGNVYAFEPSVFNLALLVKNLNANGLEKKVKVISTPLTETNQFADFTLSSTQEGGALSAFGVDYGYDGKLLSKVSSYQTLGFSLDFLFECGVLSECPEMIKIDVDGIEHLILRGAVKTISNPQCKTVLVEVLHDFGAQKQEVFEILTRCGFELSEGSATTSPVNEPKTGSINQIWIKRSVGTPIQQAG